jgi:hypothetical protein
MSENRGGAINLKDALFGMLVKLEEDYYKYSSPKFINNNVRNPTAVEDWDKIIDQIIRMRILIRQVL